LSYEELVDQLAESGDATNNTVVLEALTNSSSGSCDYVWTQVSIRSLLYYQCGALVSVSTANAAASIAAGGGDSDSPSSSLVVPISVDGAALIDSEEARHAFVEYDKLRVSFLVAPPATINVLDRAGPRLLLSKEMKASAGSSALTEHTFFGDRTKGTLAPVKTDTPWSEMHSRTLAYYTDGTVLVSTAGRNWMNVHLFDTVAESIVLLASWEASQDEYEYAATCSGGSVNTRHLTVFVHKETKDALVMDVATSRTWVRSDSGSYTSSSGDGTTDDAGTTAYGDSQPSKVYIKHQLTLPMFGDVACCAATSQFLLLVDTEGRTFRTTEYQVGVTAMREEVPGNPKLGGQCVATTEGPGESALFLVNNETVGSSRVVRVLRNGSIDSVASVSTDGPLPRDLTYEPSDNVAVLSFPLALDAVADPATAKAFQLLNAGHPGEPGEDATPFGVGLDNPYNVSFDDPLMPLLGSISLFAMGVVVAGMLTICYDTILRQPRAFEHV
jgi:hypothetical protein